jgi:hypothetical protein
MQQGKWRERERNLAALAEIVGLAVVRQWLVVVVKEL